MNQNDRWRDSARFAALTVAGLLIAAAGWLAGGLFGHLAVLTGGLAALGAALQLYLALLGD